MSEQLALIVQPLALLKSNEIRLSISDDAVTLKEQALQAAQKIKAIRTPEEMEAANPILRLLKNCLKFMDDSRKLVKGPVTKLGKDIEGVAQGYSDDLEDEEARLKGLVAVFLHKQQAAQVKEIRTTGESEIVASGGEGIASVDVWHFSVEDEQKAYLANPGLFELKPKSAAIIAAAKSGFEMPHIKTWKTLGVRVTA